MRNAKRPILVVTLICAGLVPICSAVTARSKTKPKHPTVSELLDKYAETQDKLKSFVAKGECSSKIYTFSDNKPEYQNYSTNDCRVDGKRACVRNYAWGDINPRMHLTKDKAYYASHLWDGKDFYQYNRAKIKKEFSKGTVFLLQNAEDKQRPRRTSTFEHFPGSIAMGHLRKTVERVDSIIRKADSVRVRDKMEKIGGSDCYVIEAKARTGDYTVWIDPAHGYNIAKAELRKGPGDVSAATGYVLPENDSSFTSVKNVRFKKIGDLWVPIEADVISGRHKLNSRFNNTIRAHYKITEIELNPDHDTLGSFVPDDILNGARVRLFEVNDRIPGRYTWQDGQVVDEDGQVIFDHKSKKPTGSAETKARHPTAFELLDKYAKTQGRFQSFRAKVEISRSGFSTGLMVGKPWKARHSTECDARFDKNRASSRSRSWGKITQDDYYKKDKPYYVSELWDGETCFRYTAAHPEPGLLFISEAKDTNMREGIIRNSYSGKFFMGHFFPFAGRIDRLLRKARSLSVRRTMERVNRSACYVIGGVYEKDKYTVWIDPQHGYHIAKAIVERARSNVQGLQSFRVEFKNVRFKKIDNKWVPVEANLEDRFDYQNGHYCTGIYHIKVTEMVFNPDHEALRSFVPDDIKDGTWVPFFVDSQNPSYPQYIWSKEPKVVADRKRRLVRYEPDKGILPVIKTLPKFKHFGLKLDPVQAKGKMVLVCFCDINQQASQRCVLNLAERARDLAEKGVLVFVVDASGSERKQVNAWVKQHTITFPAGRFNKQRIKEVRGAWGIKTLPRLVLADRNHIITAEGFEPEELDGKIREADNAKD